MHHLLLLHPLPPNTTGPGPVQARPVSPRCSRKLPLLPEPPPQLSAAPGPPSAAHSGAETPGPASAAHRVAASPLLTSPQPGCRPARSRSASPLSCRAVLQASVRVRGPSVGFPGGYVENTGGLRGSGGCFLSPPRLAGFAFCLCMCSCKVSPLQRYSGALRRRSLLASSGDAFRFNNLIIRK